MEPRMLQLGSQKIAYYESQGTGHPVMLIHGNSSSGLVYRHQIQGALGEKHRLVAIDLPGDGKSEPAAELSAYGLPGYAAIVAAAAEKLAASKECRRYYQDLTREYLFHKVKNLLASRGAPLTEEEIELYGRGDYVSFAGMLQKQSSRERQ